MLPHSRRSLKTFPNRDRAPSTNPLEWKEEEEKKTEAILLSGADEEEEAENYYANMYVYLNASSEKWRMILYLSA